MEYEAMCFTFSQTLHSHNSTLPDEGKSRFLTFTEVTKKILTFYLLPIHNLEYQGTRTLS